MLPIWKQDRGEGEGIGLVFDAGAGNGGELGDTVSTKKRGDDVGLGCGRCQQQSQEGESLEAVGDARMMLACR